MHQLVVHLRSSGDVSPRPSALLPWLGPCQTNGLRYTCPPAPVPGGSLCRKPVPAHPAAGESSELAGRACWLDHHIVLSMLRQRPGMQGAAASSAASAAGSRSCPRASTSRSMRTAGRTPTAAGRSSRRARSSTSRRQSTPCVRRCRRATASYSTCRSTPCRAACSRRRAPRLPRASTASRSATP